MNKKFIFLLVFFGLLTGSYLHAQTTINDDVSLTFAIPGDYDIIIPDGCMADIEYEIWGAGGSGGFINLSNANSPFRAAPGGTGGGYSTGITTESGGSYVLTVGAGGIATNFTTVRANGEASSVFGVISGGGRGGAATNSGPGGSGDIIGGEGGVRPSNATSGVGGGGGGGSGPGAGDGTDGNGATGGTAGPPNGGNGGDDGQNGANGTAPGGAGGGKGSGGNSIVDFPDGTGVLTSGDGGDGQVNLVVTNFICVLPVELVNFNAIRENKEIALKWQTASEENNSGFEIQKSSNGRDWEIIDWVKGNGTTTEINDYNYIDINPFIGENYYRLKQIDFDGQIDFSDIITVRYDVKNIVVEVSPNPSPGEVNVTVLNPEKEKMKIELYNSAGLLIWKSGTLNNLDIWKKEFNLDRKEMYVISVQIGKEVLTKKILIVDKF